MTEHAMPTCLFCNKVVDPRRDGTFRLVQGWVERRTRRGGSNAVHDERDLGKYAHGYCFKYARDRQEVLF